MGKVIEMSGVRCGRLVAIRRDQKPGRICWICHCDCGKEVSVMGVSLRSGNTRSCGCFHREACRERNSLPCGEAAMNRVIANCQANATRRGYDWQLSDSQTAYMMVMPCYYCGAEPSQVGKGRNSNFIYNGLDRVNNDEGYTIANTVPCCFDCNSGKRMLSRSAFLDWVSRVYRHSIKKSE